MKDMLNALLNTPFFGISLTIAAFVFGTWLYQKTRFALLLPFYTAVALVCLFLSVTHIDYATYMKGGEIISLFMGPLTISLALPLYRHLDLLKKNLLPIAFGILSGCLVSFFSTYLLALLFRLDGSLFLPLTLHSVTTPIALATAETVGAVGTLSVLALIISGILGSLFGPYLMNWIGIKDPVARGVAFGTCAHVIGTSKAMEESEVAGSFSGLSIGLAGLVTVVLLPVLLQLFYIV